MKPFNLEAALAGAPVVTRNGLPVFLTKLGRPFGDDAKPRILISQTEDGRLIDHHDASGAGKLFSYDLFMAPAKRTVYVNLWKSPSFHYSIYPMIHPAQMDTGRTYSGRAFPRLNSEPIAIEIED